MDGIEVEGEGRQAAQPGKRTRRLWTAKDKRRIVREAQRPGAVKQQVALRHGVHVSVLNRWRSEQLSKSSTAKKPVSPVRLLPLRVRKSPSRGASRRIPATTAGAEVGIMEVGFPAGQRLTVRGVVDGALLRTALEELSRC
ncbi:MAG: transposase [Steroidobacteraceae bacterium]